jgi:hypothetical protein
MELHVSPEMTKNLNELAATSGRTASDRPLASLQALITYNHL